MTSLCVSVFLRGGWIPRGSIPRFFLLKYICGGSDGKELACNVGYNGLVPGLGRSPGKGNGYPL